MILALLCACQLAAAQPSLVVQSDSGSGRLDAVSIRGWTFVMSPAAESLLGARLRKLPSGRVVLDVAGLQFELAHGVPFTRVAGKVVPLAVAPRFFGDSVALPLQLLVEVLPRFARQVAYDIRAKQLTLTGAPQQPGPPSTLVPVAARARRVILDAGHGGPDEGTSISPKNGPRIVEKNITLAVTRFLGAELELRGFDIVYTRTTDTLIALHDRGRIANRQRGDAFVSIHVNSAGSGAGRSAARGVETYFLSAAKTEDAKRVQAMENASVRFESGAGSSTEHDPLSFILNDMQQNGHLRESSEMAEQIQTRLSGAHPGGDRGVRQAEFAVLVGSFMPSVLVEIGFLSNQSDAAFLAKAGNQKRIATAVADAVEAYFRGYDRRIAASGAGR